jgi:hypothetical protein
MSDRIRSMSDEQLGAALASLDLDWPDAPDLSARVTAALAAPARGRVVRLPLARRSRILLIAAATVLLLAGAAVAAKLVIDLGAVVVRVSETPGTLPSPSPPPFGEPISLRDAADLLGSEVPIPAALGEPDRVWADEVATDAGTVVRISLAWHPRPDLPAIEGSRFGVVLMRFEGNVEIASKEIHADTGTLQPTWVGNVEGFWTTGPHLLRLLTPEGVVLVRVDGNVLLWRVGADTLRLETALPQTDAVRIAESMPGTS